MKIEEAIRKLNILKEKFGIILKDMPDLCDTCIEALKENQWISVEDRLPEYGEKVLVADKREQYVSIWNLSKDNEDGSDCWEDSDGWWREFNEITHWKPLPKAPEV